MALHPLNRYDAIYGVNSRNVPLKSYNTSNYDSQILPRIDTTSASRLSHNKDDKVGENLSK
jgi:hypothetical protein